MLNKKALHWAVAAAFSGLSAVGANALTTIASEAPSGSQLGGSTFTVATVLYAPTTANPLYLQFSLTSGASFVAAPTVVCKTSAAGVVDPAFIALAAGGAGTAAATFVVTGVTATYQVSSCVITNGLVQIGTWPSSLSESVVITYGNNLAPTATQSSAIFAASSIFSNTFGTDTNTALVQTGFISFSTANALAGSNAATARVGKFSVVLNNNLMAGGATAANNSGISAYVTAANITVGGPSLVAASRVFVTVNSGAAGSALCSDTLLVSAAGGTANISFSAVVFPATSASVAFGVCMSVTGATIPAGAISINLVGVPNNDPQHPSTSAYQIGNLLAANSVIGNITRNGSSTTVLNFPRAADPDAGTLRIYNTSSQTGAVTATVYIQGNGTPLVSTCQLTGSLAANSSLILSAASFEALLGSCPGWVLPTAGRYRVDLNGAFTSLRAQALARTTGVLVNLGGDTSTANN